MRRGRHPLPLPAQPRGSPAGLSYAGPDKGVHGLIHSVAQGESGKRLTRYRITLVPRLAYLQHATNQRIFQHRTVPQIITEVLKGHGIFTDSFRFRLRDEGPERVYCTGPIKKPMG
ncbi:contractile injection system protein, VgrG/Pvc8 family [Pseudomonas saudimassiliensis]|uniref:contractile injection system protein, VgrG/Pvc8 family n=1 Tax=Pseudomonas saudimassiliensis TaxID=1461581 RepID=UPI0009E219A5